MNNRNILTIDFGGTNVKYILINDGKEIASKMTASKLIIDSHWSAAQDVLKKIQSFSAEQSLKIVGIAIAFNSPIKNKTFVRWGIIDGWWKYKNFEKILYEVGIDKNIPITIINDAKAALYAETKNDFAKDCNNIVMLTIGTAIGGAVLIDGKLVNGKNSLGAELSNIIMSYNGFNFEDIKLAHSFASMKSLEKKYFQKTNIFKSGQEIFKLYDQKDIDAIIVVTGLYRSIAALIFNCIYSYGPEIVIIGGGLSNRQQSLKEIKKELDALEMKLQMNTDTILKLAKFKNKAGNYGAYYYFLNKKIKND